MRTFTHRELQELAREQGIPEAALDVAAAIALAESAGGEARGHPTLDPRARKDSNGRWSIGLWQINSLTGAAPGTGRAGMINDELAVARNNARAMAAISHRGTNWRPWGAFKNGSFERFLTGPKPNGSAGDSILQRGDRGPKVCRLQARLRELGHAIDTVAGCPFGPQTERAVKAFQRRHGLKDDGVVDPLTQQALFS